MSEHEITVAEAARRLGITLSYAYSLLWTGKLKARKVNKQWRISADAVAARLKSRAE
jgi:excisionase family DNA binding protein